MLIQLDQITKVYQAGEVAIWALRDINLVVKRGEFVAIVGQSGSGKTTLLDILGCLSRPTNGTYWFAGQSVESLSEQALTVIRNQYIGFIFQTFHLLPRKTALENVQLPLQYAGVSSKEQSLQSLTMLDRVGLLDRAQHYPTQLSGGQQQRVAIARALVNQPKILFADEPTGNLDSCTGKEILSMFQALHEQGQTIVMITHDHELAMNAERRVTLSDGQVINDESVLSSLSLLQDTHELDS
ncbi:MAG: ATP-binding cassette domain-containing protein [Nitrospirales bacterium]|nr:ATP-binding cassette domain-containing protein [Nitrospirales bacterium]